MIQARKLSEPAEEPRPDPAALAGHLKDASHFQGSAEEICFPVTEEQVSFLLRRAGRDQRPVTLSGAGTGLTGGRVPQKGLVLSTERMNRILRVNGNAAIVQPGVSLKQLEETLDPRGLFYPPDPGEKEATIGGTIATNASGPRSLKYGPTRRHIRRLRVVLPEGDLLELIRGRDKVGGKTVTLSLTEGRVIQADLPGYRIPPIKNSAGYFCEPNMDLIDLFIGAEGTLGVVTEAELALLKKPEAVFSGILFFDTEQECFIFAREARRMQARAIEFVDSRSLALLAPKYDDIPPAAAAALYFQRECRADETDRLREEWSRRSEEFGARASDCWFAHQEQDLEFFRRFRYDLPVLVNEQAVRNKFRKLATDLAVPDRHAQQMFNFYLSELPKSGLDFAMWGHLGDNHLHVNFLPKTQEEFDQALALYGILAKKAVELGGTVSGEHGIGKVRIPYLEMMVGAEGMRQMARLKKAFDPAGILNRGNIFPENLLNDV